MDLSHKIIILLLLIIIILLFLYKKQENLDSSSTTNFSTEAILNIASVYAETSGTATFNNIKLTGNLSIGNYKLTADLSGNLLINDLSNNVIFQTDKTQSIINNPTINNPTINNPIINSGKSIGLKCINCLYFDADGKHAMGVNYDSNRDSIALIGLDDGRVIPTRADHSNILVHKCGTGAYQRWAEIYDSSGKCNTAGMNIMLTQQGGGAWPAV